MAKTGRPARNDAAALEAIADYIYDNPAVTATEAFRVVVIDFTGEHSPDAARKRIVTKFNKHRAAHMRAAEDRKKPRVVMRAAGRGAVPMSATARLLEEIYRPTSATARLLAELDQMNSPISRTLADLGNPVSMISRTLADLGDPGSSISRTLADLANPGSSISQLLSEIDQINLRNW
ncbi:hypothetical protein SAMN06297129_3541 [Pseudooceanicola antarcticus]|uniref:Uncharacterized protein n=1 Tax=Pseudooceanicola antarcticus TaxID=1247613 RepID=A0A285JD52_9RHOB|nr:hypothetical protein [Pseudooceanicola antarcticus]PJE31346.1 hypothetical protein CVM39_03825 [Pseudooceanicola antarcticus]SNY58198.1 hypothetical protein SAMN06297129_3541 [Pseudooceanicola antarcticus]